MVCSSSCAVALFSIFLSSVNVRKLSYCIGSSLYIFESRLNYARLLIVMRSFRLPE
jgi:hypothetical protein